MKSLNICIDIDGTITDPYYWLDLCNKYFDTNVTEEDVTDYCIPEVLGVDEECFNKFYEKYKFQLHLEEKLRQDAKVFIQMLARFNKIYFVTARDRSLKLLTHAYLMRNKISYNGLILLGSPYKVDTQENWTAIYLSKIVMIMQFSYPLQVSKSFLLIPTITENL